MAVEHALPVPERPRLFALLGVEGFGVTTLAHIRQSRPDSGAYKTVKAIFWHT